jgi:ABC-type spermidine/putrescine transport system permease subunit II
MGDLGLMETYAAVYLAHIGFNMPLAVFVLRSYMATLPTAVVESAKVDGASHFQIFWRVVLPLSVPALAAFAAFQFLWVWNDLLIALLYLSTGERQVVTVTLGGLIGSNQIYGWQLVTGGAIITIAVPVLVFVWCTCISAPAGTTRREVRRRRCPRPRAAGGLRRPRSGSGGRSAPARTRARRLAWGSASAQLLRHVG